MFRSAVFALSILALPVAAFAGKSDNEKLCTRFYEEVVNKGALGRIDEFMSEKFVEHEAFPGLGTDREGVRQFFAMMHTAFPDLKITPEFLVSDGDKVVAYTTMSGTHKGEFMGMPATGKTFSMKAIDILRFADGKVVEHWGVTDSMAMMEQLSGGSAE